MDTTRNNLNNVPAERLRRFLGQERREELQDLALNGLLDDALASERTATVERIRAALDSAIDDKGAYHQDDSYYLNQGYSTLTAILDAEAR